MIKEKTDIRDENEVGDQETKSTQTQTAEQKIKTLVEKGKKKGFLTYEEMNKELPDDAVSPSRLDSLLATLDELGISLVDEADVESQQKDKDDEDFAADEESLEEEEADTEEHIEDDELLEKELVEGEISRRIDDPIRMYLTQMGQIPLLTRKSEISLARKIEITRMAFRRKMLQCDYCARNSVDLLQQVFDGSISFDRTLKTGTAPSLTKGVIKKRLLANIMTVNKLLKMNQALFKKSLHAQSAAEQKADLKRLHRNRRKVATLLEVPAEFSR